MAIFLHAQHGAARRAQLQQRAKDDRPHFLKVYTSQLDMNNSKDCTRHMRMRARRFATAPRRIVRHQYHFPAWKTLFGLSMTGLLYISMLSSYTISAHIRADRT